MSPSRRFPYPAPFTLALAAALLVPAGASAAGKLAFAPAALDFGFNALGEAKIRIATLKNGTGADIALNAATLADNPGGYAILSTTCGATLPARQTCKYTLKYTAQTLQPAAARLELTTQDPAFPLLTLPLQANRYPALNDTGITNCSNADTNDLPCPVTDFPGQDAQFGRDKTRNVDPNGKAGFKFTRLGTHCVRDNVTGLVWEKKPTGNGGPGNQGLHDADDKYTWYSTDANNNGGSPGYDNEGQNTCYGYKAGKPATYCNTEAYVNRVNAAGWCGFKDWRLPDRFELLGLADISKYTLTNGIPIDSEFFPDTISNPYWSSSPDASNGDNAWAVDFHKSGMPIVFSRNNAAVSVRLVRGGP